MRGRDRVVGWGMAACDAQSGVGSSELLPPWGVVVEGVQLLPLVKHYVTASEVVFWAEKKRRPEHGSEVARL